MAQNHVQPGKKMYWINGTGSTVLSESVVIVGGIVGVAEGDIVPGEEGVLAVEEVYRFPKKDAEAMPQGTAVYWDDDGTPKEGDAGSGCMTATEANGKIAGYAFAPAAAEDAYVEVKLNAA